MAMANFNSMFPIFTFTTLLLSSLSLAIHVSYDSRAITFNGERKLIISGSIHYPRSTPDMWPSLIRKAKEGGLDTIETYVFWNAHEPVRRQYDFGGHLDLVRFIKTVQKEGLNCILRIGPYVCAEWNYGGLPVWLQSLPNIELRTSNPVFMDEMKTFVTLIVDMMRHERLFASQGGPIILAQIENEYGNVEWGYTKGHEYVQWCADLAQGYRVGIPWLMCQQDDAPLPLLSSCNGMYCDNWFPKHNNTPKIWTENWTGWFKDWGNKDPHRPAEDVAFAVARFFQRGGSVQNYYMYHGGTNFGTSAGGPYISTSYDYDAPLDEYGNLNQPKWGHLKELHLVLKSMEKFLLYGDVQHHDFGGAYSGQRAVTVYSYKGKRACFFSNGMDKDDYTFDFDGNQVTVGPWSVSIQPDCYTEAYNTAKVNAQTSVMVKAGNEADDFEEPYRLKWTWKAEHALHLNKKGFVNGAKSFASNELLDQKTATNGTNDYLWLMTVIDHNKEDPVWGGNSGNDVILHIHSNMNIIHVFLNGRHIGTQVWDGGCDSDHVSCHFVFEKKIKLKQGKNSLSILSVTVGLKNYDAHYDTIRVGVRGPVKLIARGKDGQETIKDISSNRWVYKNGLDGEDLGLTQVNPRHPHKWYTDNRPANKMMIWYKTTFKAPMGNDPVVVDLMGLGKGAAWVNGFNIGRYWPKFLAPEEGCDIECDYRGTYWGGSKCNTNCGKPTQRWYHIPRYHLKDDDNELVLFEEFGGTPDLVTIQTVTVRIVCAHAYEGNTLELSCQGGRVFSQIKFASFGLPEGTCGSFNQGECNAADSLSVVKQHCLGKPSCSISVSEETFEPLRCRADTYRLAVETVC